MAAAIARLHLRLSHSGRSLASRPLGQLRVAGFASVPQGAAVYYIRSDGAPGAFLPPAECRISVDDRGFLFADGLYEVTKAYTGGLLFTEAQHMTRLERGLRELSIGENDAARDALLSEVRTVSRELLNRNRLLDGPATIYVQITRGTAPRAHAFPKPPVAPTVFVAAKPFTEPPATSFSDGVAAVTERDTRWGRCDLKTVGLLANVLANQRAKAAGAYECLFVRGRNVVEASHSNVFAVIDGELVTPPLENLLAGVTRSVILARAGELGIRTREGPIPISAIRPRGAASELFTTATTTEAMPIVEVDCKRVGDGKVGPITRALREAWPRWVAEDCALSNAAASTNSTPTV